MFIDNLDKMEENKESNIHEYLRFSLANNGFWKSNAFRRTSNIAWLASLDMSSSSILESTNLSPRIMRHFNVFYLPEEDYIDAELGLEFKGQILSVKDEMILASMSSAFNATTKLYSRLSRRLACGTKIRNLFSLFDIKKSLQRLIIATETKGMKAATIPQMWFHECYNVFTARLTESQITIFDDILRSVYTKYFQDDSPNRSLIFSDLNVFDVEGERQIYRSLNDVESNVLVKKLNDEFPQFMSYPYSLSLICKLDADLGNRTSFTMVKTSVGGGIVSEYTRAAAYLRGYEFSEIKLGIYEDSEPTWSNIFKSLIKQMIFEDSKTTVLLVSLDAGCEYTQVWNDLSAIVDHGRTTNFWSGKNEYRDCLRNFYRPKNSLGDEVHILESEYHDIALKMMKHVQAKLKIVLCLEAGAEMEYSTSTSICY
jgi:hypothetical protein